VHRAHRLKSASLDYRSQ